ncbi:sugar diacid recognition domain-containing protein [uncultured Tolumonas sp.]|uniref:sugar diacid recognition domain-containing protein n=1 Tax=uncultured Tolumonas sp. TaxID=263765 RepID=UPI00292E4C29|nr:sugar diacid recognition domain-containing protein [uncultured Tolumonas sp.]
MSTFLDSHLARMIVEKTMSVIDFNVNIMDEFGIIIWSGDLERIGQRHEGALLVLSQQRIVNIDENSLKTLKGVKPGVNIPLWVGNEIVGVLGLTGNPEQLHHYGALVAKIAEMIIEQARMQQSFEQNSRLREELALSLIRNRTYSNNIVDLSNTLDIDLKKHRLVIIGEVSSGQLGVTTAISELKALLNHVEDLTEDDLIAIVSLTEIVILKSIKYTDSKKEFYSLKNKYINLAKRINESLNIKINFAIGNYIDGDGGIYESYQTAKSTLKVGKRRLSEDGCFSYFDLEFPVLVDALGGGWQGMRLLEPIQKIKEKDTNGTLYKTLIYWFNNNTSPTITSEKLYIHRNTLEYRLKRVSELTNLDLSNFEDKLMLYISFQLDVG